MLVVHVPVGMNVDSSDDLIREIGKEKVAVVFHRKLIPTVEHTGRNRAAGGRVRIGVHGVVIASFADGPFVKRPSVVGPCANLVDFFEAVIACIGDPDRAVLEVDVV